MEKNEWDSDWLHDLGALILTMIFMLSPIICTFSWKYAFASTNVLEIFGYGMLAVLSSFVTGAGTVIMYHTIKECC